MNNYDQDKYERAKKQVQAIKGFYSHLVVYLIVNAIILLAHMGVFRSGFISFEEFSWSSWTTPFFWGIGLFFHGLYVFQHKFKFFRAWEERKIREYMEKDDEDFKRTDRWDDSR